MGRAPGGSSARARAGHGVDSPRPSVPLVQPSEFGDYTLWHFDLSRLGTPEAVFELGIEDALDNGVSLVEWPERMGPLRPADRLDVMLTQGASPDARIASLEAHGGWVERLVILADD